MAKLKQAEMAAIRWFLGQVLVLISLAGCYSIDLGASWLVGTGGLLAVLSCIRPGLLEKIPPLFWRVLPYFLLAGIGADFFMSGGDILPPLFRMIVILAIYRLLQVRTPREDLQLLLLSLFMIIVTGVFSQDITFGVQLLFYTPVAIGLLFMANLSTSGASGKAIPPEGPVFRHFSWKRMYRRTREQLDTRTLAAGSLIFLLTSVLTFLLFILLPRFDIGAALPFPRLQTSQSLSGFSDHVRFGDVVSILNDDSIAMRVDVEMENPPALPYWRMVVLDAYYDGGFMVSPRVARERNSFTNYYFLFDELNQRQLADDSRWTLYLEGGISSYLPMGDAFRSIRFNNRIQLQLHRMTRVFKTSETNANTLSLRVEGMTFGGSVPRSEWDSKLDGMETVVVNTAEPAYLKDVQYPETLLVVPDGRENIRIMKDVLRRMDFRPGMPAGEFSNALMGQLRSGRGYSLQSSIPDGRADNLLRWVESGEPGHCELYAGAFVLIARYAGYPTRMVTGYVGGDWNGFESYYMVRNRDAHAWCEVYHPGEGWLRVDPTPGYGADQGTVDAALALGGLRLDRTWKAYLDSLRVLWYRRVIQFDSQDQAIMADAIRDAGTGGVSWMIERFKGFGKSFLADWKRLSGEGEWGGFIVDLVAFLLMALMIYVFAKWIRKRHKRNSFEAHVRKHSGAILRLRGDALKREHPDAFQTVLAIRYGPMNQWPNEVEKVLRGIRKL